MDGFSWAVKSDVGATHDVNQDACCIMAASSPSGCVILSAVCDGVGGLSSGERASASVIGAIADWFKNDLPKILGDDPAESIFFDRVQASWKNLIQKGDDALVFAGRSEDRSLATTLSCILYMQGSYLIAHVGDCRIYTIADSDIRLLTEDQTLAALRSSRNQTYTETAQTMHDEGVILQAIGVGDVEPSFYRGHADCGSTFVLLTDGAYRRPGEDFILEAFSLCAGNATLAEACEAVIDRAISCGEADNLTVAAFIPDEVD